jgi:hypothetical protein
MSGAWLVVVDLVQRPDFLPLVAQRSSAGVSGETLGEAQ